MSDMMKQFLIIGLLLGAVLFSGCANPESKQTFRVGTVLYTGAAGLVMAKEKGFFADENLHVEILIMDAVTMRQALHAGQVDYYYPTVDAVAFDAAQGVPAKIIYLPTKSNGADGIVAATDIQTMSDLRGKKIAVQKGIWSHFFLVSALKDANVSPDEVTLIEMDGEKAPTALLSGDVDAAVGWEPYLSKTSQAGPYHILATTHDSPVIIDAIAVNNALLEKDPKSVAAFVRALEKGYQYTADHPDESAVTAGAFLEMSPAEYMENVQQIQFVSMEENRRLFESNGLVEKILTEAGKVWQDAGLIVAPLAPSEMIHPQFVNATP